MKKYIALSAAIAFTVAGLPHTSVLAQQATVGNRANATTTTATTNLGAIVIAFPNDMQFEVEGDRSYPTTLLLIQPIVDRQGRTIVPENSPVQARLVTVDDGIQIMVDGLVVGGQVIPVQATSAIISTQRVSRGDRQEQTQRNAETFNRLGASIGGLISSRNDYLTGPSPENAMRGGLLGNALGMLGGLLSSNQAEVAYIPQGSVYVLTLQAPITRR